MMSDADEIFNLAHDQELYAFEGETNLPLLSDGLAREVGYAAWDSGFSQGWERGIRAIIEMIDKSPAVLWAGKGGVKERLESLIEEGEG